MVTVMTTMLMMMVMITKTRTSDATLMIDLMEHKLVADSFAQSNSSFFVMMGMPEMIKEMIKDRYHICNMENAIYIAKQYFALYAPYRLQIFSAEKMEVVAA